MARNLASPNIYKLYCIPLLFIWSYFSDNLGIRKRREAPLLSHLFPVISHCSIWYMNYCHIEKCGVMDQQIWNQCIKRNKTKWTNKKDSVILRLYNNVFLSASLEHSGYQLNINILDLKFPMELALWLFMLQNMFCSPFCTQKEGS